MDALTFLREDHKSVLGMLEVLDGAPQGTGAASSGLRTMVTNLVIAESQHEAIEEQHFWPAVRKQLPDGDHYADTAQKQEQEGKDTLAELGRLDPDSRKFDEHVEQFVTQVRKHVAFEELVFLKLREAMSQKALDRLGRKLLSAQQQAGQQAGQNGEGS